MYLSNSRSYNILRLKRMATFLNLTLIVHVRVECIGYFDMGLQNCLFCAIMNFNLIELDGFVSGYQSSLYDGKLDRFPKNVI